MVFPSVPVYLDPPNWNQAQANQEGSTSTNNNTNTNTNNPGSIQLAHGNSPLQIRPNSMAEKARLAKIPQPETCLKCPRCESTNTKFCYFNNYSLSQPRHFCKTCRRYWTRGGALRNVPVGGGCRRNKRSTKSSSSSKSSAVNASAAATTTSSSSIAIHVNTPPTASAGVVHADLNHDQLPNFMGSLHPLEYGVQNLGLNFTAMQGFQDGGLEQWRIQQIQQFPFLGGMDQSQQAHPSSSSLFPFDHHHHHHHHHGEEGLQPYKVSSSSAVKMEDHNSQRFNIPRQFITASRTSTDHHHHHQYWNSNISGGGGGGGNTGTGNNGGWSTDISGNLL